MTSDRALLQQALDALIRVRPQVRGVLPAQDCDFAIHELTRRLEQPEAEPYCPNCYCAYCNAHPAPTPAVQPDFCDSHCTWSDHHPDCRVVREGGK